MCTCTCCQNRFFQMLRSHPKPWYTRRSGSHNSQDLPHRKSLRESLPCSFSTRLQRRPEQGPRRTWHGTRSQPTWPKPRTKPLTWLRTWLTTLTRTWPRTWLTTPTRTWPRTWLTTRTRTWPESWPRTRPRKRSRTWPRTWLTTRTRTWLTTQTRTWPKRPRTWLAFADLTEDLTLTHDAPRRQDLRRAVCAKGRGLIRTTPDLTDNPRPNSDPDKTAKSNRGLT